MCVNEYGNVQGYESMNVLVSINETKELMELEWDCVRKSSSET